MSEANEIDIYFNIFWRLIVVRSTYSENISVKCVCEKTCVRGSSAFQYGQWPNQMENYGPTERHRIIESEPSLIVCSEFVCRFARKMNRRRWCNEPPNRFSPQILLYARKQFIMTRFLSHCAFHSTHINPIVVKYWACHMLRSLPRDFSPRISHQNTICMHLELHAFPLNIFQTESTCD